MDLNCASDLTLRQKDFDWGKYMMDANGLLPLEGFLSDTLYLCNIFGPAAAPNCDELPEFLTHVVVRMPVGFLRSPGSMDLRLGGVHTKFRVKNLHSFSEVPTGQPWL